ncbi:MAG: universal stress protein [Terriglobales bacterium]
MAAQLQPAGFLQRVLFATDFSPAAASALPYAAALARAFHGCLYAAHVIEVEPWETAPELTLQSRIEALRELDALVDMPGLGTLPRRAILRHGGVAPQLLRIAEEQGMDAIVTGTEARHGLGYLLAGSVSEKLARAASCSVLAVGPRATHPDGEVRFRNLVLLAYRNPAAAGAVQYAARFAASFGARLQVLHAIPPGSSKDQTDSTRLWLHKVVAPELELQVDLHWCVAEGEPQTVLCRMAETSSVDLVMLGPGAANLLPEVMPHLPCPVMAVRQTLSFARQTASA